MTDQPAEGRITIEATGGFVYPAAHVRTWGEVELGQLPAEERAAVERLFERGSSEPGSEPRYRLTWQEHGRSREVEVGESELPASLRSSLKTDLV